MQLQTAVTVFASLVMSLSSAAADVENVAKAISTEATRKNFGLEGRPLPLVCSWQCGHYRADHNAGWRPENQMRLIEEGHYLLPWFSHPWEYHWPVNVFSLALVRGKKPNRRWLIYTHSPRGDQQDVRVTIPDYDEIRITSTVGGSFYVVGEVEGTVSRVHVDSPQRTNYREDPP